MIRRVPLARVAPGLLFAAGTGWTLTHRDMLDLESIESTLRALGIWTPIGFILIYATGTVLFFSGALLSLAGGALFGPVWGSMESDWRDTRRYDCLPPDPHGRWRVGGAAYRRPVAAPG
jgi:uncharacterized membrane protein YdjX (TVP38/TMEM64 family)